MRALVGPFIVLLAGAVQAQQPADDGGRGNESAREVGAPSRSTTGGDSTASRFAPTNKMRGSPILRLLFGSGPRLSTSDLRSGPSGLVVDHERWNADFIWGIALGYEHNLIAVSEHAESDGGLHNTVANATTSTGIAVGGLLTYLRTGEEPFAMGGAALSTSWRAEHLGFYGVGTARHALGRYVGAGARLGLGVLYLRTDYEGFFDGANSETVPAAMFGVELAIQFSPQALLGWHLDGRALGVRVTLDWYEASTVKWHGISGYAGSPNQPITGRARFRPSHWAVGLGVAFAF